MPVFLTVDDIKLIHTTIEQEFPFVEKGILKEGLLSSVAERPDLNLYGNTKQFENIFLQAASLMESITRWHPFVDGNKRTGLISAFSFLYRNGYYLALPLDSVKFTVKVAETEGLDDETTRKLIEEISFWLNERCSKDANGFSWKVLKYFWWPNLKLLFLYDIGFKKYVTRKLYDWFAIKGHPEYEKEVEDVSRFLRSVNALATSDLSSKRKKEKTIKRKKKQRSEDKNGGS